MSKWLRTILGGCVLLMPAAAASGYCPLPTPKVCSTFFLSDAVFLGTVISVEEVADEKDGFVEGWNARLNVVDSFRGLVQQTAVVHTANDSGRLVLEVGGTYLVFAKSIGNRLEVSHDCGPLSEPSRAPELIREIDRLLERSDAVVEGEVREHIASGPGAAGISVSVSGTGNVYHGVTAADGSFRIVVPPGEYAIEVDPAIAHAYDLNRVDPRSVNLVAGQCAQLLFIARR